MTLEQGVKAMHDKTPVVIMGSLFFSDTPTFILDINIHSTVYAATIKNSDEKYELHRIKQYIYTNKPLRCDCLHSGLCKYEEGVLSTNSMCQYVLLNM
jgi:hypothetical protein